MTDRPRVLLVDDERNLRLTMRAALEGLPVEVDEAADGLSAVASCERTEYAALVLDLRMPKLDGLAAMRRIRALRPHLPVLVVTAHGTVDAAVEAMKLGARDFVEKPFDPPRFRGLVAAMLHGDAPAAGGESAGSLLAAARNALRLGRPAEAAALARRAVAFAPDRPEGFHVLGAAEDLGGDRLRAQVLYRTALALDPTYAPSARNLERSVAGAAGPLRLGDEPASGGDR